MIQLPSEHFHSYGGHSNSTEEQTKRLHYYVYSASPSLYSSLFTFSHLCLYWNQFNSVQFKKLIIPHGTILLWSWRLSHHFHSSTFSPRSLTLRVSFIHLYGQLHAKLSSHPLTSIVTPLIGIITSTDHHLFRLLLLSPPFFLLIVCFGTLFIT